MSYVYNHQLALVLRHLILKLKQSHDPPLLIVFCIKAKPTGFVLLETHWCVFGIIYNQIGRAHV